jgi:ferredoxin-NADP reductase/ferredoxin/predicted pyridoxine 5'-phosphate oxidase superfamily flavin-nucleotide-binding protein
MAQVQLEERILSVAQLREIYDPPNSIVLGKVITRFDKHVTGFVQAASFLAAHFRDDRGEPVPVIAGGPRGFARVIDPVTVEIEIARDCWPQHKLRLSGNAGYSAGLLLVIPGIKETLRMKGTAIVARAPDLADDRLRITLRIDNTFFHCAKAFIRSRVWEPSEAMTRWKGLREFKCVRKEKESAVITSFYFAPIDGGAPPVFLPGQHIPIQIAIPGLSEPVRRAYSLSNRPGEDVIRISVKREAPPAIASSYLHDHVEVGSVIEMRAPAGRFVLNEESARPVVLLSAGVGLTPMVSMLDHLVANKRERRIWYFHGTISGREHAMRDHVRQIAQEHKNVHTHVCYGHPREGDIPGRDFDTEGRLSMQILKSILPWDDYEFYICGPTQFMKMMAEGLMENGVRPDRIRWEAFSADKPDIVVPGEALSDRPAKTRDESAVEVPAGTVVAFRRSGKTVGWDQRCESLLDLAEANGVTVRSGCRTGECFTCAVRMISGDVSYAKELEEPPDEGSALICSAVPRGKLVLDL